jgi:hypothetical protein
VTSVECSKTRLPTRQWAEISRTACPPAQDDFEVPTTETEITAITNVGPSMFIGNGIDLSIAASSLTPVLTQGLSPPLGAASHQASRLR